MTDSAQIIRDGNGNPAFAVLPIAEYERLLEAADEATATRAFDVYKATQPETFPDEVAERLLGGEHPVKVFRDHRGMTQAQLAEATGLKQAYVSQIEAGTRGGSVDVLKRIADALRVELDDLT
ncbi:helix-turn-helix domain-containing protein [Azospirillum argentinense]|uniref:Helix-turn-helix protein n=1 Tax=Azospirillum brasilense TaxID=192 RepID=A0A560CDM5_AZOBR|nr:helix-turn-helix transcriptional regulator [Azospirillum brasilense]MBK3734043.1 helix-turn-helix domain-containing protein [Azospirillum brasilense]TWA82961.1 helix-turn-helix protein [Azospirillum brasilense]